MSRMILVLCALVLAPGCCTKVLSRNISLAVARVETLGPCRSCDGCSDCIPPRPRTCGYYSWWDNHITQHTAQVCALRALKQYKRECGGSLSHHFEFGFISAYEDLAFNRQPRPRFYPPPLYWNAFYRSCEGQPFVDDWYDGYDVGLDVGSESGVSQFNQVYLNRNDCGADGANAADGPPSAACDNNAPQAPLYDVPGPAPAAPRSIFRSLIPTMN